MLQAQMPVSMADNSLNLNEPGKVKSEKPGSLENQNKFKKIYESASSERKKVKKVESGEVRSVKAAGKSDFLKTVKKLNLKPSLPKKEGNDHIFLKSKNGKSGIDRIRQGTPSPVTKEKKVPGRNDEVIRMDLQTVTENSDSSETVPVKDLLSEITDQELPELHAEVVGTVVSEDSVLSSRLTAGTEELKLFRSESRLNGKGDDKAAVKKKSNVKKTKLKVVDLRGTELRSEKSVKNQVPVRSSEDKPVFRGSEQDQAVKGEDAKPIVVEMVHIRDNTSGESKTMTTSTSSSLMRQLEETVNSKIVKQSSVILKDDNTGEIKLILKPESMGRVRIRLNLNENRITGQIVVENAAVKEIFEQNLQNLERAFKENGYDTASLNVSVGGDGRGSGEREKNSDIAKHIEMIDEIIPTMWEERDNLIDLVV